MIYDLANFVETEQPFWRELQGELLKREQDPHSRMDIDRIRRFHYLYQRAAADLARIGSLSTRPETSAYLESLVARAYSELHDSPERGKFHFRHWLVNRLPQTFRVHIRAFAFAVLLTVAGAAFGSAAIGFDPDSKSVLMPFAGLMSDPGERVKSEESARSDRLAGQHGTFAAQLMTHNIQVALFVMALGMTWGVGSIILLFYNGVTLGAVAFDYIYAGYTPFLLGWLLPHGVIEIPAILVAGQASFVLANALVGWGDATPRTVRLRAVSGDVLTLAGGAAFMLVWAGIVEGFVSQFHQPVLPYALKIAFGCGELILLGLYFARAGRT